MAQKILSMLYNMRLLARLVLICRRIEGINEFALKDMLMPYNWCFHFGIMLVSGMKIPTYL